MDKDALRILDANINRTREALRVIEDYARFVLDDPAAAAAAKQCRHRLRGIVDAVSANALLEARDIVSDVGRDVKTAGELQRASVEDVVRAAFARLAEACRALGEYGKLVSFSAAEAAESLRYHAYELEQRVVLRGALRRQLRKAHLYVLLTESLCSRPWLETAAAAIDGGAGCIQLREKKLDDGELLHRAVQLRELTARHKVLMALNDRPDLARLAAADVLHVGQGDLAVRAARRIAGAGILVGKSTHTAAQCDAAAAEEPDYLAVGPMFASATKPQGHVAGPGLLAAARERSDLPLVAIGGIDADNAAEIYAAGADCVAVCRAVIGAGDIAAAAAAIVRNAPPGD